MVWCVQDELVVSQSSVTCVCASSNFVAYVCTFIGCAVCVAEVYRPKGIDGLAVKIVCMCLCVQVRPLRFPQRVQ